MKKKIFGIAFVSALLLSALAGPMHFVNVGVAVSVIDDWPMFHYDAAHSGSPDNIAPTSYDFLWSFNTLSSGSSYPAVISSSPVVANGVVYIGSDDGSFYALNASSGSCIWNCKLGNFATVSPVLVGGVVYVGVWEGFDYALNASTGMIIWNCSIGGLGSSSPAVANGMFYLGKDNGDVIALNASTGASKWTTNTISGVETSPVVVGDSVYVVNGMAMYSLDAFNGTKNWSTPIRAGATYASPAVVAGVVYVGCEGDVFYAFNAITGAQLWNCSIGPSDQSTPAVVGGVIYVGTITGYVYALDANTGSTIWRYKAPSWVNSSPAVAGAVVFVGCNDGNIYALNANTGAKLWSYATGNGGISSSPAVVTGVLYVKSNNGYLYAFGKAVNSSITLSSMFGPVDQAVTVLGTGFAAGSLITATFGVAPLTLTGDSTVDSTGHFSGSFTISSSFAPGTYTVSAKDNFGNSASASFMVIATPTTFWPMFQHDPVRSGSRENIAAVDNHLLWTFAVDKGPLMNSLASSPAIVDGIVYDASQNGFVYALDANNGACYWSFNAGAPGMGGILSSPVVADGVVYIGGGDNNLYAINAYSGAKIWSASIKYPTFSSPAVSGGVVYIGLWDGNVGAFRASNGQSLWSYKTGGYVLSSPAVVGNVVYVGSMDGNVYALNAATSALIWKYNTASAYPYGGVASSPAVSGGIVCIGSNDGNVFALDASNGNKIWNYTIGRLASFQSPTVANGVVYVGSDDDNVYALNAANGNKIWNYSTTTNYPIQSTPAIAGGIVYVGSNDGNVYALDALIGSQLWTFSTGSFIRSSPAIAHGVVYVGAGNGNIYAIGTPTSAPTQTPTSSPVPTPKPIPTATPTPLVKTVPATTANGAIVDLAISGNVTCSQISNVAIATNQFATTTTVSFTLSGQSGTAGFGNVTIPKSAVPYGTAPTMYIDNLPAQDQGYSQDSRNYYVWYTTHFSTHEISIVFTTDSIPEFSSWTILLLLTIMALAASLIVCHKKNQTYFSQESLTNVFSRVSQEILTKKLFTSLSLRRL